MNVRERTSTMRLLILVTFSLIIVFQAHAIERKYSVKDFVRYSEFHDAKISPSGEYIAVTQQIDRQVLMIVLRLTDLARVGLIHGNPRE